MDFPLILFIMVGLPVLCVTSIVLAVILRYGIGRHKKSPTAEETRLIQSMHHQLGTLEKRIESLETILLERVPGKDDKQ